MGTIPSSHFLDVTIQFLRYPPGLPKRVWVVDVGHLVGEPLVPSDTVELERKAKKPSLIDLCQS